MRGVSLQESTVHQAEAPGYGLLQKIRKQSEPTQDVDRITSTTPHQDKTASNTVLPLPPSPKPQRTTNAAPVLAPEDDAPEDTWPAMQAQLERTKPHEPRNNLRRVGHHTARWLSQRLLRFGYYTHTTELGARLGLEVANLLGIADFTPEERAGWAKRVKNVAEEEVEHAQRAFAEWRNTHLDQAGVGTDGRIRQAGGEPLRLGDAAFLKHFRQTTNTRFNTASKLRFLVDGQQAWEARYRLIELAEKQITVGAWLLRPDATGQALCEKLIEKKKAGVDVFVVVDKQAQDHYDNGPTLERLRANGVHVLEWSGARNPADGHHAKWLMVDGRWAIVGGMNIGDPYSHGYGVPPELRQGPGWPEDAAHAPRSETIYAGERYRDTDVLIEGSAAAAHMVRVAEIWNARRKECGLTQDLPRMEEDRGFYRAMGRSRSDKGRLSSRDPLWPATETLRNVQSAPITLAARDAANPILTAMFEMIAAAKESISISNPYFLYVPGLAEMLAKAHERGVQINLLINSDVSIDSKTLGILSLLELEAFAKLGVNIHLQREDLLHNKFIVVDPNSADGSMAAIGSWNIAPRSAELDIEWLTAFPNQEAAQKLQAIFDADVQNAIHITDPEELRRDANVYASIAGNAFFRHL